MAYESKAIVTSIKASGRVTLKIRDNFHSAEYSEERAIPDETGIDIEEERKLLCDTVSRIVDDLMYEMKDTFQ